MLEAAAKLKQTYKKKPYNIKPSEPGSEILQKNCWTKPEHAQKYLGLWQEMPQEAEKSQLLLNSL